MAIMASNLVSLGIDTKSQPHGKDPPLTLSNLPYLMMVSQKQTANCHISIISKMISTKEQFFGDALDRKIHLMNKK